MLWNDKYRVPSARKSGWDYSSASWYFVTVCEVNRTPAFGRLQGEGEAACVKLSPLGLCIARHWQLMPAQFPDVVLEEWQVMPDHFHALLWLDGSPLGGVMGCFKGRITSENATHDYASFEWQPRFHDEIVRTQEHFDRVQNYIRTNPQRALDRLGDTP